MVDLRQHMIAAGSRKMLAAIEKSFKKGKHSMCEIPSLFMGGLDAEIAQVIREAGYQVDHLGEAYVVHRPE